MEDFGMTSEGFNQEKLDKGKGKDEEATPPTKKPGSKGQGRKRTKSGCLTCRKRRIKCGEERPTCQNCTKSKRQCEGYNQRVVFKDPLSAYRPSLSGSGAPFGPRGHQQVQRGEMFQQQLQNANPLPIAPKPSEARGLLKEDKSRQQGAIPNPSPSIEQQMFVFPLETKSLTPDEQRARSTDKSPDTIDRSHLPDPQRGSPSQDQPVHYDFNALVKQENLSIHPAQMSPLDWSASQSTPATIQLHQSYPASSTWDSITPSSASSGRSFQTQLTGTISPAVQSGQESVGKTHYDFEATTQTVQQSPIHAISPELSTKNRYPLPDLVEMVEDEDDPFDVSDDDVDMGEAEEESAVTTWHGDPENEHLRNNDLGIVVALQARQEQRSHQGQARGFNDFIDRPDMLATYSPSFQSSPLKDPMTARIFCHFINVTAPSISQFERNPANPSLIFQGAPVPKSQQHIWTYTFATLALQEPALLHAMLAIACLHISQLQKAPATTSLKHYHISLRRIGKALKSPSKRLKPSTLAAAMLLGFYECWCADHQKWTNHLLGAKHLLNEIDFAGISKHIKLSKLKKREEQRVQYYQHQQQNGGHKFMEDTTRMHGDDIDENIVGMLMGKKVRYDEYGQVVEESETGHNTERTYTEKELEVYETQSDLWWWYAKQDVYQSILGGGKLFMNYDRWSKCPPRAPLGRLNAIYGTYDHLILLMGRVASFAAKDMKRKRIAARANGGWRPPPGMRPPGPPPGQMPPRGPPGPPTNGQGFPQAQGPPQGPPNGPPRGPPQMPSFSGMLPVSGEAKLPMGFEEYQRDASSSPKSGSSVDSYDLELQRLEAEEEWQEIRNMFSVLEEHFGPDFQAMGPEFTAPIQTPFGPALQYRTYGIAGIWMNYYMGLIACHRAHPAMPPAAMMAAGVAARQTASMANEIGRIAAGLAPDCSMTGQVSPSVGAGLIESATCLFISGVQYQDPAQRLWTITRLRDISRLTGWQTAVAIATGCETSWIKTAEAGHGPPYTRTAEDRVVPDIWASGRRVDRATRDRDGENRLVVRDSDRAYYALGVLGLEDDFDKLEMDEGFDDVI